jgi:hypothetical protein
LLPAAATRLQVLQARGGLLLILPAAAAAEREGEKRGN